MSFTTLKEVSKEAAAAENVPPGTRVACTCDAPQRRSEIELSVVSLVSFVRADSGKPDAGPS